MLHKRKKLNAVLTFITKAILSGIVWIILFQVFSLRLYPNDDSITIFFYGALVFCGGELLLFCIDLIKKRH